MPGQSKKLTLMCPYCHGKADLQPGDRVWPNKGQSPLYVCENYPRCNSYVRCHEGTTRPLGTLADKRLRGLRKIAHDVFDPLWKASDNELGRSVAYEVAGTVMGVKGEFHIGNLDAAGCQEFIRRIGIIEMQIDDRLEEHFKKGAPPGEMTLEVLHSLFHPDRDTFLTTVPLADASVYEKEWSEANRCGLVIQQGFRVTLSPKGRALVFDATT